MTYNDPTEVRGGECDECGCDVRDNELDLWPWGRKSVCAACYDTLAEEAQIEEDEARQELLASEAQEALSGHDRDSWFNFAASIALAPFNGRA